MPDISGASWRFAGSSPLPRLVSKTASESLLFPESVSGTIWLPVHEWRKLPQIQGEWTPTKECGEQARRRLADKQRVKPVFTQVDGSAMQRGHLCGEGRQARVGHQVKRRDDRIVTPEDR
jgi:hypothetical protein